MKHKHFHPFALIEHILLDGKALVVTLFSLIVFFHLKPWQWALAFALWMAYELLDYVMSTYQLTESELILSTGIINRKVRHLPYQKIQNIHESQWFFLKPFQLEKISVDSAGQGGEKENQIQLPIVPTWLTWVLKEKQANQSEHLSELLAIVDKGVQSKRQDWERVRAEEAPLVEQLTRKDADSVPTREDYVAELPALLLYAMTAPELLAQFFVLWGICSHFDHDGKLYEAVFSEATAHGLAMASAMAFLFIILLFAFNVVKTVVVYYGFSVKQEKQQLLIQRGLFERRSLSLTESRIQSVQVNQSWIRRLFGYASVRMLIITDRNGDDDVTKAMPTLMPIVKTREVTKLVRDWLPSIVPNEEDIAGPIGHYQSLTMARNGIFLLWFFSGWTLYFVHSWWAISLAFLLTVLVAVNGWYKGSCTAVQLHADEGILVVQDARFSTKETFYIPMDKIQAMSVQQSLWLAHSNKRAHLVVTVRSDNSFSEISARYLKLSEAEKVYQEYKTFYSK
ncbi:PH domain-containing protein [Fructobacillus sp. CRL 2054]|uniref:PH domain-containing protein n=1 Tax=Fructobacillus sp. CRL 2054 TaxID=2763007 RepID=UPI002378506F|nr:PH domain-containing protein [Fructobacillus sp. CRL 2054]MDD9138884.1 PH domain-containing protein [Fructobacillus sp. CRL 2054]